VSWFKVEDGGAAHENLASNFNAQRASKIKQLLSVLFLSLLVWAGLFAGGHED